MTVYADGNFVLRLIYGEADRMPVGRFATRAMEASSTERTL